MSGRRRDRWGPAPAAAAAPSDPTSSVLPPPASSGGAVSDDAALAALLSSAERRAAQRAPPKPQHQQQRQQRQGGGRGGGGGRGQGQGRGSQHHQKQQKGGEKRDYYGPAGGGASGGGGGGGDGSGHRKRQRRWGGKDEAIPDLAWGTDGGAAANADGTAEDGPPKDKKKADFGLSGALAGDEKTGNVYNGILLKFSEPPEARAPNTRWRLYVFRKTKPTTTNGNGNGGSEEAEGDGDLIETLHVSRQSAYLFGRERKVADIPVDHPSLSKQHAVLQYRVTPDAAIGGRVRCRPYLMDLGSTNGTFVNGVRLDDARYYELRKGDVITLGASSREYVLLTENSTEAGTGVVGGA